MIFSISSDLNKVSKITESSFTNLNIWERQHIQEWVRTNPEMLGEDLLVVSIEFDRFSNSSDRLDVLAMDRSGNLVVIELKRDSAAVAVAEPKPAAPVAFDAAAKYKSTCAACYGVTGQGQGAFPKLAGRSADELAGLLNGYKIGKIKGSQSAMMMPIAVKLSAEIKALSGYLAGLK